ncbi:MAG: TetR/AcrR family transcriptional regulator [Spirochaetota bacterium]
MGIKERKEREKEQRREHIINISERLFVKKDFDAITMDEIAREGELSKGALYLSFKSKEEIFLNIIYKATALLYDIYVDAVAKSDNPIFKLRGMGEGYIAFYDKYPEYFKLLNKIHNHKINYSKPKAGTKEIGKKIIGKTSDIWKLSQTIIEDGIKKGIFKKQTDPQEIAVSLWAMSTMFIGLLDHLKSYDHSHIKDIPFNKLDIKKLLIINGRRIIFSILKNPPKDIESLK